MFTLTLESFPIKYGLDHVTTLVSLCKYTSAPLLWYTAIQPCGNGKFGKLPFTKNIKQSDAHVKKF